MTVVAIPPAPGRWWCSMTLASPTRRAPMCGSPRVERRVGPVPRRRRGIDESPGAPRDDALDEPAGEIRQSGGQPVDVSLPACGRGGVYRDALQLRGVLCR